MSNGWRMGDHIRGNEREARSSATDVFRRTDRIGWWIVRECSIQSVEYNLAILITVALISIILAAVGVCQWLT